VGFLWHELTGALPLIFHGNSYIVEVTLVTIQVAFVATGCALIIGLPIGTALGLGRFRGRRALQVLANTTLALPPVLVGVTGLLFLLPQGPLGGLRIEFTLPAVFIAQTILALPYIIALTPAAIQGLPPGLIAQARVLGAGRVQLSLLALREAKIGVMAAVIAALGSALSEVAAVILVGGNVQGYDQTLASAVVQEVGPDSNYQDAIALGIVLLALIFLLMATLTVLQQRTSGINLRFRHVVR
jgi:tungstate transport system permease protein